MTQPTTVATRPATVNPLRRWLRGRSWRWWATCWVILGSSEFAAIFAQMQSKTHVVAPSSRSVPSAAGYDAGWPLTYAHIRYATINYSGWHADIHFAPPMSQWQWGVLIVDVAWTGIIFAVGVALPVIAWWGARRQAAALPAGSFWRVAAICAAIVGGWFAFATTIVTSINQGQPTDAATWAQLTHPATFVALFPGVLSFVVQRGFEGEGGLSIALTNGPATYVELALVTLVAVALPAGILARLVLATQQLRRWRRPPATTLPEGSA